MATGGEDLLKVPEKSNDGKIRVPKEPGTNTGTDTDDTEGSRGPNPDVPAGGIAGRTGSDVPNENCLLAKAEKGILY